jgi:type III pantothenate kinase
MLLAIDVGNTNIVFAIVDGDEIRWRWRISTHSERTADEYAVWLNQLMAMEGARPLRHQVGDHRKRGAADPVQPARAGAQICRCGADGGWHTRSRLWHAHPPAEPGRGGCGPDRECGCRARDLAGRPHHHRFRDCDDLRRGVGRRRYEGGAIAPGINLSMDALYRAAARLPRIAVEPPAEGLGVIGKGTVHAMQSGLFWGYVGMIEGLVQRMQAEIGRATTVIATGGLAALFSRHSDTISHVDPDLTIKGLARIHAQNFKRPLS